MPDFDPRQRVDGIEIIVPGSNVDSSVRPDNRRGTDPVIGLEYPSHGPVWIKGVEFPGGTFVARADLRKNPFSRNRGDMRLGLSDPKSEDSLAVGAAVTLLVFVETLVAITTESLEFLVAFPLFLVKAPQNLLAFLVGGIL